MGFFGLFNKEKKETLDRGLEKSKESVLSKIGRAIAGKSTIDDDVLDNLEEALITSDVGVETTLRIIEPDFETLFNRLALGEDAVILTLGGKTVKMYVLNKCLATLIVMIWNYFSKRAVLYRKAKQ